MTTKRDVVEMSLMGLVWLTLMIWLASVAVSGAAEYSQLSSTGAAYVLNVSVADDSWTPAAGWVQTSGVSKGDYFDGSSFIARAPARSISGVNPSTATAQGDTLAINLDNDGVRTIVLGDNSTGASVFNDVMTKVRALTANNPANQAAYDKFVGNWNPYDGHYYFNSRPGNGHGIVISGGTAAASLKLGVGAGGTETVGVGQP